MQVAALVSLGRRVERGCVEQLRRLRHRLSVWIRVFCSAACQGAAQSLSLNLRTQATTDTSVSAHRCRCSS
jgi:hypothetical protein